MENPTQKFIQRFNVFEKSGILFEKSKTFDQLQLSHSLMLLAELY